MKKFMAALLAAALALSLAACGGPSAQPAGNSDAPMQSAQTGDQPSAPSPAPTPTPTPAPPAALLVDEFHDLLAQLPLTIDSTRYVVQDEQHKTLYPDMLQVILHNYTQADIKNAVVAFAAWDVNDLPVKIKGSIDFSGGAYIRQVNYNDINLVPNATFGDRSGYEIDANCNIARFEAVVVSFETFGGDSWSNPYYTAWCQLFEGVKYSDSLSVTVTLQDASFDGSDSPRQSAGVDEAALLAELENQPLRVTSTRYIVQDEQYKNLYPDMLQAVLINETDLDIKNAVVAFVAWDANNLPVKIKGSIDFSDGAYIRQVNYNDINLVPGATYGESSGYEIDADCGIVRFKAIVVSYEAFTGETWTNPYYQDWCRLYEGVKLEG